MDKKKADLQYVLSRSAVKRLTAYYVVIIVVAMVISIWIMSISINIQAENILFYTGMATISVAAMLCCLQYLKRLYKACIDKRIVPSEPADDVRALGNSIYFVLRPLYAMVFAVVADFALLSGVIIVSSADFVINNRFMYLCILISSMIGFSIGRVLDAFETISEKKIQSTLSKTEDSHND